MSWRLFGQIVLLIIITAIVLTAAKYCSMHCAGGGSKMYTKPGTYPKIQPGMQITPRTVMPPQK